VRFLALLLMLLVLAPRTALASLSLGCEREMKCACCQHHQAKPGAPRTATFTRAPCCAQRGSHDAAPVVATARTGASFELGALAVATPLLLPTYPHAASVAVRRIGGARAPPVPKCPLFLKNHSLLL